MKKFMLVGLMLASIVSNAQKFTPQSITLGYYGETITHPGLRIGAVYPLRAWEKSVSKKSSTLLKKKEIQLIPSLGFFHHRNYQNALFFVPEFGYSRTKENGNYVTYAIGMGYMRTFLPAVYELNTSGDISRVSLGYNYFTASVSACFGRDLSVKTDIPLGIYVKPQGMIAVPNAISGILYFGLEAGVSYKLGN